MSNATKSPVSRAEAAAAVAVVAGAFALAAYGIDARSLWLDEGYALYDARGPLNGAAWNLQVRPLFYVLLRAWRELGGDSVAWARGFSACAGAAAVAGAWALGRDRVGPRAALLGAAAIAASPRLVAQAQEVRMYALGTALAVAGAGAAAALAARPSAARLAGWIALRVAMILTIPLGGVLVAVDLALLWRRADRRWRAAAVLVILGLVVAWAPIAHTLWSSMPRYASGWGAAVPAPTPDRFASMLFKSLVADRPPFLAALGRLPHLALVAAVGAFFVVGLRAGPAAPRRATFALAAWGLIGPVVLTAFSFAVTSLWIDRYLTFSAPFLLLVAARGVTVVAGRRPRLAAAGGAFVAAAMAAGLHAHYTEPAFEDWRQAGAAINARFAPGDAIVVVGRPRDAMPLAPYLGEGLPPIRTIWGGAPAIGGAETMWTRFAASYRRRAGWLRDDLVDAARGKGREEIAAQIASAAAAQRAAELADRAEILGFLDELPADVGRVWLVHRIATEEQHRAQTAAFDASARFERRPVLSTGPLRLALLTPRSRPR